MVDGGRQLRSLLLKTDEQTFDFPTFSGFDSSLSTLNSPLSTLNS